MTRIYRRADLWALIFVYYVLAGHHNLATSSSSHYPQRCRSNANTTNALQSFVPSLCEMCTYDGANDTSMTQQNKGKPHIGILVRKSHPSFETLMILAAGLLTHGHRVTILHFETEIVRDLLQRIPCQDQSKARSLLAVRAMDPPHCNLLDTSLRHGEMFACETENAELLVKALKSELQSYDADPLNLLVVDGIFVAGLLVAELLHLPTLALMEGEEHLRHILGPQSLSLAIQDRLQVLQQWDEYFKLNQLRQTFGLKRLRTLSDFWTNRLLITSSPNGPSIPNNLLRIPFPLLPPCIPCQTTEPSASNKRDTNETVPALILAVTFPDTLHGRISSRTLMQALSIARASLHELTTNAMHDFEQNRWSGPSDFIVVRLGDALEELQPQFVITENTQYLLDSVVRHMPVLGILTQCQNGADDYLLQTIGPPVLCWNDQQSTREIATAILSLVWGNRSHVDTPSSTQDGLAWFISLIDDLLTKDKMEMQSFPTLRNPEPSSCAFLGSSPVTTWTGWAAQYLAWSIMISVVLYVYLKPILHSFYPLSKRKRSHNHLRDSHIHIILFDDFVERLPELDHVFAMWTTWLWQELASLTTLKRVESNTQSAAKNKRRSNNNKKKH